MAILFVEELKTLKDGWYDGKGNAPPLDGLDWLVATVNDWYNDVLPLPYLYPVAEGGVRLEWTLGTNEVSLEIDLSKHTGHWHLLNIKTDDEEVKMLNLNLKEDWDWMSSRLQTIGGEGLE